MASLGNTIVDGNMEFQKVYHSYGDYTPWQQFTNCANTTSTSICNPVYACTWLHIRTPLRLENNSGLGWNPGIVECVGYHTYGGDYTHDYKWVYNINGYDGSWYGNQLKINVGYNVTGGNAPVMYRSSSYYNGYRRLCLAIKKVGCCCNGWVWVRWWKNASLWNDYPWATVGHNNETDLVY